MKTKKIKTYKIGPYGINEYSALLMQRVKSKNPISQREYALAFQRDKERIMHSKTFKLLKYKSQMVDIHRNEMRKNKLTHTFEVAEVAKKIGVHLELNTELIGAIALGHDLGCTPFGHIGERALHRCATNKVKELICDHEMHGLSGFKHNYQSLHVVDHNELLSKKQGGLNLTFAVREGIVKHASGFIRMPLNDHALNENNENINYESLDLNNINMFKPSITLEGQTVAIADKLVTCIRDLEESMLSGHVSIYQLEHTQILKHFNEINAIHKATRKESYDVKPIVIKSLVHGIKDHFISDVVTTSVMALRQLKDIPSFQTESDVYHEQLITLSEDTSLEYDALKQLMKKQTFSSEEVKVSDDYLSQMIEIVFEHCYNQALGEPSGYTLLNYEKDIQQIREICDYVSSMSDESMILSYEKLIKLN